MADIDHVNRCNAHDLAGFVPFLVAGQRVGWVRRHLAGRLLELGGAFIAAGAGVAMADRLDSFQARSTAMAAALTQLHRDGLLSRLRGELFPVTNSWGETPLLTIDRAAVELFGVRAYGLHVNGFVRRPDGLHLWIGVRALDKHVAPGKLDNIVAGGQPHGLTLAENLLKEAAEEADIGPGLARTAVPVGMISYTMETKVGLKPDTLFVYDLELDAGFVPRNTDGEITEFHLMPVAEVAQRVRDTDDFKFNVNLVIIDFLIRHGLADPDEPGYAELACGLRR